MPAVDEVAHVSGEVVQVSGAVDEDVLAATGFDSGVALLVGVGLMTAGAAAVLASRKRARS
ncbi:MAG: LPXTG cell wall anchor domain-containing protein [Actinobacteria bacterium]|nr:LPXTG cell wall anchor domain-containing protein [Actinomycetota bacterium]